MRRLYSLVMVEEKLLEAHYFSSRLASLASNVLRFEFNAFLSSARSITFLLQKELNGAPYFREWWETRRQEMRSDPVMRFFLDLRNYSQKEGPIRMVGTLVRETNRPARWSYRFAGNRWPVPEPLLHRDVSDCCREYLGKLATIVLAVIEAFPYCASPRRGITPDGLRFLGLHLSDLEQFLGLPKGVITSSRIPEPALYRILQSHFDDLDLLAIRRIADYTPRTDRRPPLSDSDQLSAGLSFAIVQQIESEQQRT